jgi:hypothetical protein
LQRSSLGADGRGHILAAWGLTFVEVVDSRNGLDWSAPGGPAAPGGRPAIAGDGAGAWIAVWTGASALANAIFTSRSIDDGATWSEPIMLSRGSLPDVATDGRGAWITVWAGEGPDIFATASHDRGVTWTVPVRVGVCGARCLSPRIATDGDGVWVVVWESEAASSVKSDVLSARSLDDGASWSAAILLSDPGFLVTGFVGAPDVATNAAGEWLAAWTGRDGLTVARSMNEGVDWSAPTSVSGTLQPPNSSQGEPSMAAQGDAWVIVWGVSPPPVSPDPYETERSSVLWLARSDDGMDWTAHPTGLDGNHPNVATDGSDGLVAVWHVVRFGRLSGRFMGIFYPDGFDVFAARSSDGGATWSPPVRLNINNAITCQKPSDCDDHDSCTIDACAPDAFRPTVVRCDVTPVAGLCLDGDVSTRDVCTEGACSSDTRPGFGTRQCSFHPELIPACAGVSLARPVRRRIDAACGLARRAIVAVAQQRPGKSARLKTRAGRLLARALVRGTRPGLRENTTCATALGTTLGEGLQEIGGNVIVATNPDEVDLPGSTLTLTLPPGDYLLFGSCTIRNARSFADRAQCALVGTEIASPEIEVQTFESRPLAMLGDAHLSGTTHLEMHCTQRNYFQFASLVSASRCTAMAVARPR